MKTQGQPTAQRQPAQGQQNGNHVIDAEFEDVDQLEGKLATVRPMNAIRAQTTYLTAAIVPVPRQLKVLLAKATEEAELAGEDFEYYWTVKAKQANGTYKDEPIEGISIDGAMIMMRHYGNCACPVDIVVDAPEHWVLRATFIDLETGTTVERLFRQRKNQRLGKMDQDRALDIQFQIGQSKAQRNAIDKAMPIWLKTACVAAARKSAEAKIKNLPKACEEVLEKFGKASKGRATQDMLEWKSGKVMPLWNARDIVRLNALYKALVERQTSMDVEFPPQAPAEPEAPAPTPTPAASAPEQAKPAAPPPPAPEETFATDGPAPAAAVPAAPPAPPAPPQESATPEMCEHDLIRSTCPDCKGKPAS
jgi:hypothetical protein